MVRLDYKKTRSIVIKFSKLIPKYGDVLDLGCGSGNNSLFLAKRGFKVIAIDMSSKKLLELKNEAKKKSLLNKINIINANLNDFKFHKIYSAIISTNTLHFLQKNKVLEIIKNMKNFTIKNGLNIVSVFTKNGQLKSDKIHFFENEELKKLYNDWEILFYEEKLKPTIEKDFFGNPKKHEVASIVAKKI